jgi:activator of HSP90 ATPase
LCEEIERMKTRTIRQTVFFKATPHEVYEALMDPRKHAEFTGGRAVISRKVGGKINIYDGYITGENIELVPDKKIVQLWKPDEGDCWPSDHYSKATFALKAEKSGTRLTFTQTGVPVDCGDRFDTGWKENYWGPMKEMFEKR